MLRTLLPNDLTYTPVDPSIYERFLGADINPPLTTPSLGAVIPNTPAGRNFATQQNTPQNAGILSSLAGLFKGNQNQSQSEATPFDWKSGAMALGLGLLNKMDNRDSNILTTAIPLYQQFNETAKKQTALTNLKNTILNSPALKDDATRAIASALAQIDPVKAVQFIKQKEVSDYTLGNTRFSGKTNQPLASAPESVGNQISKDRLKFNYWSSLPVDTRSNIIAVSNAMGFGPREAEDAFIAGKTLKDLAIEKKIDPNLIPDPAYPPTKAQINQIQQSTRALKEMDVMDNYISKWQAPFAQRFSGWSPASISASLRSSKEDKTKIAHFIAAKILQTEGFAARFKGLGGNVSEAAIDKLMKESLADFKVAGWQSTPEIWEEAQSEVSRVIKEAAQAGNRLGLRQGIVDKKEENQTKTWVYNSSTGTLSEG